jgi:DHA3 family macrolide efflux protein-like MFS transporter
VIEPVKTQWSKIQAMALARSFSLLGSQLTIFTLVFREQASGPTAVAVLFIVGTLPVIIFSPWAGTIADRFSTRQIVPPVSIVGGAAIFALALDTEHWITLALLFLANTCLSVVGPTWGKLIPVLATKEDTGRAMGTIQSYFAVAGLAGPFLAGFLVDKTGYVITFVLDGIFTTFIALVPFILKLNFQPEERVEGEKSHIMEGYKFMMSSPLLRSIVTLVFGLVFCVSVINVGDIFLITEEMGASKTIYGLVGTGFAVGMLLTNLLISKNKVSPRTELIVLGFGMGILSISGFFVGISPNYWVVMVVWFIAGAANATINSYGVGMMIKVTPHEVQGRVFAAFGAVVSVASTGSMGIAGFAVEAFGVREVFMVAGLLAAIAFLLLFPTVYREQTKIIKASSAS